MPKARFWRALLHYFITSQQLLKLKCRRVSSHLCKLRLAHARLRERASLSIGYAWHLPRFIALLYIFAITFNIKAQAVFFAILRGRKNTFAIRPNKCKCACGTFAHGERLPLAANCISMDFARFLVRRGAVGLKADFALRRTVVFRRIKVYPPQDFAFSGKE